MARIIEGVEIKPAPSWMRYRLVAVGLRPINNVVDITNYVLLELGHPLHGFDRDLLKGNKIRIAKSKKSRKFKTLDGQTRELLEDDLLFAETLVDLLQENGFEVKHTTSPKITSSMRIALTDLKLERLDVIHTGEETFMLDKKIRAVALVRLLDDIRPLR